MPSTIGVGEAATRSLATLTRPPTHLPYLELGCIVLLGIVCTTAGHASVSAVSAIPPQHRRTLLPLTAYCSRNQHTEVGGPTSKESCFALRSHRRRSSAMRGGLRTTRVADRSREAAAA